MSAPSLRQLEKALELLNDAKTRTQLSLDSWEEPGGQALAQRHETAAVDSLLELQELLPNIIRGMI